MRHRWRFSILEAVVEQSRHRFARRVRFCAAVLSLLLSGLISADPIESPGDEAMTVSPPSPPGAIDAPVPPQTPTPTWSGNFWKRSQLTGDWFGSRRRLAEDGLSFFGDLTQYYQGVTTGGRRAAFRLWRPRRLSARHRHRESGTLGRWAPRSPRRDTPGAGLQRDRRCGGTVELRHGTPGVTPERDGAHGRAIHARSLR